MFRHEIIVTEGLLPFRVVVHKHSLAMITKHWHESVEINYTVHGDGDYFVSGRTTHLSDDDFIIINSGEVHGVSNIGPGDRRRALTLLIPMDTLLRLKPDFKEYMLISTNGNPKQVNQVRKQLRDIYLASTQLDKGVAEIDVLGHFYLLISELFQHFLVKRRSIYTFNDEKKHDKVKKIIAYLMENYRQPLNLNDLAQEFGFSRNYLDRLFKKEMDTSLMHYLQLIRLDFAYKQITNTKHSITQIADECGFANPKSLQKLFKQVYGKTPNEYRKNMIGQ